MAAACPLARNVWPLVLSPPRVVRGASEQPLPSKFRIPSVNAAAEGQCEDANKNFPAKHHFKGTDDYIGLDWIGLDWISAEPEDPPLVRALRSAQKSSWPIMPRPDDQLDLDARERACVNLPFSHHFHYK